VTRRQPHYNAPAFTQRQLANEHVGQRPIEKGLPYAGYAPAPFGMNNSLGVGKRLVVRVVLLQAGCAGIVGLCFGVFQGAAGAWTGLSGGLIVAIGSGIFGWRMYAPGIAPAARLHRALFAAESLKWFWYGLSIWAALTHLRLQPLPLITGLVFAQFGYWFGLVGMKRG
jgi:F0F1-type ATP synthase assembly protein I